MLKFIKELSSGEVMFKWNTENGEVYIEITPTEDGLEIYCDGEGCASITIQQDTINAATISPTLE